MKRRLDEYKNVTLATNNVASKLFPSHNARRSVIGDRNEVKKTYRKLIKSAYHDFIRPFFVIFTSGAYL